MENTKNELDKVYSADNYIKGADKASYANNVVLVDIFDRSTSFVNAGSNQTHTVVLWKKTNDKE